MSALPKPRPSLIELARASKARHDALKTATPDDDREPGWNDGEPIDPVWLREFNRLIGRTHQPH